MAGSLNDPYVEMPFAGRIVNVHWDGEEGEFEPGTPGGSVTGPAAGGTLYKATYDLRFGFPTSTGAAGSYPGLPPIYYLWVRGQGTITATLSLDVVLTEPAAHAVGCDFTVTAYGWSFSTLSDLSPLGPFASVNVTKEPGATGGSSATGATFSLALPHLFMASLTVTSSRETLSGRFSVVLTLTQYPS